MAKNIFIIHILMIDKKPTKLYWQTLSTSPDFTFNISLIKWFELLSSQQKIECSLKKTDIIMQSFVQLLSKPNEDKLDWVMKRNIYDYEKMRNSNLDLKEEIVAKALHPKRIFKLIEEYGEDEIYNIYLDD
jgi:hypothetical protein